MLVTLHASEAAAQCIVIAPVCVFVCLWVRLTTASTQCLCRLWALFSLSNKLISHPALCMHD